MKATESVRNRFEGRTVAEAAIAACETLGITRSELVYTVESTQGELLDRKVVIVVESPPRSLRKEQPSAVSVPPHAASSKTSHRAHHTGQAPGKNKPTSKAARPAKTTPKKSIDALLDLGSPKFEQSLSELKTPATSESPLDEMASGIAEKLRTFLKALPLQLTVREVRQDGQEVHLSIEGVDAEKLLGDKGSGLSSLQFVFNRILLNHESFKDYLVVLDIANYRARRVMALQQLAQRLAFKAKQQKKAVRLSPMSAYDRRVFHLALQQVEGVQSRSEGNGELKNLLIIPEELL